RFLPVPVSPWSRIGGSRVERDARPRIWRIRSRTSARAGAWPSRSASRSMPEIMEGGGGGAPGGLFRHPRPVGGPVQAVMGLSDQPFRHGASLALDLRHRASTQPRQEGEPMTRRLLVLLFTVSLAVPGLAAADAVTEWNEIAIATAAAGRHGASDASRTTALV